MKIVILFVILMMSLSGQAEDVKPAVRAVVEDPLIENAVLSFTTLQHSMTIMERIRKEILQKSLESVKGKQEGFTTDKHVEKVTEACAKSPLCAKDLEAEIFGVTAFDKVQENFYEPLLKYNATINDEGLINEDETGFYDLKYTPAMDDLEKAEDIVRRYFFVPLCPTDPIAIDGNAPAADYKDVQDKYFLRRQQYMTDLSLISFDLANEVYQAVQKDLEKDAQAPVGGISLQDDLYVTLKAQEAMMKKLITEITLQVRLAEMAVAKTLLTLPLQLKPKPLYRQQQVERLMRIEDPTFDMQEAIKGVLCPGP